MASTWVQELPNCRLIETPKKDFVNFRMIPFPCYHWRSQPLKNQNYRVLIRDFAIKNKNLRIFEDFKAPSTHGYFLMCVFAFHHQTVGCLRANTKKKVGEPSAHTPLCRHQCVGQLTCPCKLRTSLHAHQAMIVGNPKLYRSARGDAERNVLMCMWGQCLQSTNVMQIHK